MIDLHEVKLACLHHAGGDIEKAQRMFDWVADAKGAKALPIEGVSDAVIKHMVDRFLRWKLPEDFRPDAGISFKPTFNDHMTPPMRHEPTGTNLFSATQAEAMVRFMVEGLE